MKKLSAHSVGIEQGDTVVFSDFEDEGEMWSGTGPRERRCAVQFGESFADVPTVQTSVSLWDVDTRSAMRAEITAENITPHGYEIVFRTWGDTRLARLRVSWMAIGPVEHPDDWKLY